MKIYWKHQHCVDKIDGYEHKTYPHKDDTNPASCGMACPRTFVGSNETSNDEMACSHSNCSSEKNRLATELVDIQNSRDGKKEFNHTNNTRGQQRSCVSAESEVIENERSTEGLTLVRI